MSLTARLDAWGRGWRGPCLAALIAFIAGLPGLLLLPPMDRDESRFAEASAQMLESGDYVAPYFQDTPRFKKPVGIYWLQAMAVNAVGALEDRAIWAWRLPSLIGAMVAAAACAWGAGAFMRPGSALAAGGMLATSFLLSTEADIAATDAVLCGTVTAAMAALARMFLAQRAGAPIQKRAKIVFWSACALSVLVKGPVGPMVVLLTMIALCAWERKVAWLSRLGWGWGLILTALLVGPWAMAITVATDGGFWGAALGGDLAPKLIGEHEGHGAPPGYYLLLSPLLLFPACLLLPAGLAGAWRDRADPAVRFALCWLVPSWLVFECVPTKLPHYTLPLFGALAWLMARALETPIGRPARLAGMGLILAVGSVLAVAGGLAITALREYAFAPIAWAALAAVLFLIAAVAGARGLRNGGQARALATAGVAAVLAHGVFAGALAPSLAPMWLSSRAVNALTLAGLSPRLGVAPGPVAVAGYEEPSLVFLLGADTVLGTVDDAADAVADGRPAIVEARLDSAFQAAVAARGRAVTRVASIAGLDYSNNQHDTLTIYRPAGRGKRRAGA